MNVCVDENVDRLDLMVESCGRDFVFAAIYTQSPVLDSGIRLGSNCGIHLDWEAGKKTTSRDGRLLCRIALYEGREIGAHFGAHLDKKPSLTVANDEWPTTVWKTSRKVHKHSAIYKCNERQ